MTLKSARIARAENLTPAERQALGIESGLVIIESRNPNLREQIVKMPAGGIREYLLTLGPFIDQDIEEGI